MSEETSKSLKKSSRRNTENVLLGKKSALSSRTAFIESLGATCKNWQWSWSFVNKEKKFVIFGEWQGRSDRKPGLIFSNDWEIRNGRRNRGFRQGLEHIRLIIEDGFKLFTFPMIANEKDEEDKGRVRIKRFINKVTEKTLLKKEDGWYALPILPVSDFQNHDDPTEADGQKAWTKDELTSAIKAYLMMLEMQNTNKLVNKTVIYRTLAAKTGRSSKSIEYRMQNISYVLQLSGRTTVIGLAPARNVGTNVISQIEEILAENECRAPDPEVIFNAEVSKLKRGIQNRLPQGTQTPQRKDTTSTGYVRSAEVVAWILNNANGKCEACDKEGPFITNNDDFFLEVHHVRFLSEGGPDTIENAIAVCPNCHRAFHYSKDKVKLTEQLYKNVKRLVVTIEDGIS